MHQDRRSLLLPAVPLLTAAVTLAAALLPVSAAQASTTGWRVNHRVKLGAVTIIASVAALRPADAWAMGITQKKNGGNIASVIERWNGRSWGRVTLPSAVAAKWNAGIPIATIAARSDSDLWAFSELVPQYLRRSGTHWSTGTLPQPAGAADVFVNAGVDRGPGHVWALGGTGHPNGTFSPYAARFNGTRWTMVKVPGHGPIVAVSAISASDIWAVTGTSSLQPFTGLPVTTRRPEVLHWNGTAWHAVHLPARLPGSPSSILAVSDHDVWIGGSQANAKHGTSEYAAQFTGRALHVSKLRVAAASSKFDMIQLVSDGHGGIWGLAASLTAASARFWHRTGSAWHGPMPVRFGPRTTVVSIARVPGTTSMWGAGSSRGAGLIAVEGRVP